MERLVVILFILFIPYCLSSQVETKRDTLNRQLDTLGKRDSVPLFKDIKTFASGSAFTNLIYQILFKEPSSKACVPPFCGDKYSIYQGHIIRNIKIIVLDPFGYIRGDTVAVPLSVLEKIGNKTHLTTRKWVIRNLLLFKKGDVLDSIRLSESERLLRLAGGNRDALINIVCPTDNKDSLDIVVVVRDQFSITGGIGIGNSASDFSIADDNFLGLSNKLDTKIAYRNQEPKGSSFDGRYIISNIGNSLITGLLSYSTSSFHSRVGLSFERQFVTPLIKWAGGFSISYMKTFWPFDSITNTTKETLNFLTTDTWIARSYSLREKRLNEYSEPKFIIGARYYRVDYDDKPSYDFDANKLNQNTSLYLVNFALSSRGYYQDMNIYRFDRIEDVPRGRLISFTVGYENKEFSQRPYYGFKISAGEHLAKFGYLSGKLEYGTLVNNGRSEQGVFNAAVNYLTDIWNYRSWKMRQFISYRLTCGFRRQPDEKINLSGDFGLLGFNSGNIWGTNRAVLNLSTVIYLPYKVIGFQFAPIIFADFGALGDTPISTIQSHIYQSYGLGLLIRNEYLVFNTVQISFSYLPSVPGKTGSTGKLNPLTISVIRFLDYSEAKPEYIRFQ